MHVLEIHKYRAATMFRINLRVCTFTISSWTAHVGFLQLLCGEAKEDLNKREIDACHMGS